MKCHLKEMEEAATLREMQAKVAQEMQGSDPLPPYALLSPVKLITSEEGCELADWIRTRKRFDVLGCLFLLMCGHGARVVGKSTCMCLCVVWKSILRISWCKGK